MVRENKECQIHRTSQSCLSDDNLNSQLKVLGFFLLLFCFYLHILISKNFFLVNIYKKHSEIKSIRPNIL